MKRLLIAAALLSLLFGCVGVPQSEYDAMKAACIDEKGVLSAQLEAKESKIGELTSDLARSSSQKISLESEIASLNTQMAPLKNDSNVLKQARMKSERMQQYDTALALYNDAYGPGKIPNTARLNRIETQVQSLSDPEFLSLWKAVRGCSGINECENAKESFVALIGQRKQALALEISQIVR